MIVHSKCNRFVMLSTKGKMFFRTDILNKTNTWMKLMKNLVTILGSLWTRYLIKINNVQWFAVT